MYIHYINIIRPIYTFFYLYTSELMDFLLFYPIGMLLTAYVLSAILYMLVSASNILRDFEKFLIYNLSLSNLSLFFECALYMIKILPVPYSIIYDFLFFFSKYIFIFYLKRIQFYFFWFFVVTFFINW